MIYKIITERNYYIEADNEDEAKEKATIYEDFIYMDEEVKSIEHIRDKVVFLNY